MAPMAEILAHVVDTCLPGQLPHRLNADFPSSHTPPSQPPFSGVGTVRELEAKVFPAPSEHEDIDPCHEWA